MALVLPLSMVLIRLKIRLNSVIGCTYRHLLSWSPFPALYTPGGNTVRELRDFLKSENQLLLLHWIAANSFHHRRLDGDEINLSDERRSSKVATEFWILDMDYDGLRSGFLWNPRDIPTHSRILLKLTKKHRQSSTLQLIMRAPSSLANKNFEKWAFIFI